MGTVSKKIADDVIAGKYDEDGIVKIVAYDTPEGETAYGCVTERDDPDKYHASQWVRNPRIYWERP